LGGFGDEFDVRVAAGEYVVEREGAGGDAALGIVEVPVDLGGATLDGTGSEGVAAEAIKGGGGASGFGAAGGGRGESEGGEGRGRAEDGEEGGAVLRVGAWGLRVRDWGLVRKSHSRSRGSG